MSSYEFNKCRQLFKDEGQKHLEEKRQERIEAALAMPGIIESERQVAIQRIVGYCYEAAKRGEEKFEKTVNFAVIRDMGRYIDDETTAVVEALYDCPSGAHEKQDETIKQLRDMGFSVDLERHDTSDLYYCPQFHYALTLTVYGWAPEGVFG